MEKISAENNTSSACRPSCLERLILLLSIVAGSSLLHAQAPWQIYPFIDPTLWQLVPYVPPTATPAAGSLEEAQQKVSKSVVFLATTTDEGSGYLIRTDPTKSYVCMLTAGHVISDQMPTSALPLYLAFNYVRRGAENYATDAQGRPTNLPANGTNNLSADWVNNVSVEVAGRQEQGYNDWALLKIPKAFFPLGAEISELPVSFATSITANATTDLFSIHHGNRYPQRLSVLPKNQYTDIDNLRSNSWLTEYWSAGGIAPGSSGAPLIQYTTGGNFAAVGILTNGLKYQDAQESWLLALADFFYAGYSNLPSDMRSKAQNDKSVWVNVFYMLANIQSQIETHCGPQSQTTSVTSLIPKPIPAAAVDVSYTNDDVLKAASTTVDLPSVHTAYTYTNRGAVTLSGFALSGRHAFLYAQQGDVSLGEGFSVVADATTSLQIGLMGSVTGVAAARQGTPSPLQPVADERFVVYPNPAHERITIQLADTEQPYQVRIVDIRGQTLWQETDFRSGVRDLELSSKALPPGMYVFHIQPQQGTSFSVQVLIQ